MAHPISYLELEEMMEERGAEVDHSMLNRWVLKRYRERAPESCHPLYNSAMPSTDVPMNAY